MTYFPGMDLIALHFSRTELELLVNAVEVAGQTGCPLGEGRLRVIEAAA